MQREERLERIRETYGQAVHDWCLVKERQEGAIPCEDRISSRIRPSEPPPPPSESQVMPSVGYPGTKRTAPVAQGG